MPKNCPHRLLIILAVISVIYGILAQSCGSGTDRSTTDTSRTITLQGPINVNLYIDNSGSMYGYLSGSGDKGFKTALTNLKGQLGNFIYATQGKLSVNYINTVIYNDTSGADFQELNPHKYPFNQGSHKSSILNNQLGMILKNTDSNSVSIFISDCIYSLPSGQETGKALGIAKYKTRNTIYEKLRNLEFSTVIIQLQSKFTGGYWDMENQRTQLPNAYRPYYIWIIIPDQVGVSNLLEDLKPSTLDGYQNIYYLSDNTASYKPYYTILGQTNKIGSFERIQNYDHHPRNITAIRNIKFNNGDTLQFSVAVNLSNVRVDDKFKLDVHNYIISSGATIRSIKRIKKDLMDSNDYQTVKDKATHFITIDIPNSYKSKELEISLPRNMIPQWVDSSASPNDHNPNIKSQLGKTFGLKYLIEGITEAYQMKYPNLNTYFSLQINLK